MKGSFRQSSSRHISSARRLACHQHVGAVRLSFSQRRVANQNIWRSNHDRQHVCRFSSNLPLSRKEQSQSSEPSAQEDICENDSHGLSFLPALNRRNEHSHTAARHAQQSNHDKQPTTSEKEAVSQHEVTGVDTPFFEALNHTSTPKHDNYNDYLPKAPSTFDAITQPATSVGRHTQEQTGQDKSHNIIQLMKHEIEDSDVQCISSPHNEGLNETQFNNGEAEVVEWQRRMYDLTMMIKRDEFHRSYQQFDYNGLAIPSTRGALGPWKTRSQNSYSTAGHLLNAEIKEFLQANILGFGGLERRRLVAVDIIRILREHLDKKYMVYGYGVPTLDLQLPSSDICVGIQLPMRSDIASHITRTMTEIHDLLKHDRAYQVRLGHILGKLTVYATHIDSGMGIQISPNLKQEVSSTSSHVKEFVDENKEFHSLYSLLWTALLLRNLTDVNSGGVSEFTLATMIGAWQRLGHLPTDVGGQLLSFLSFWGTFDTVRNGMSPVSGLFLKHDDFTGRHGAAANRQGDQDQAEIWRWGGRRTSTPWLLCLLSPSLIGGDLGFRLYAIKHIQRTFEFLHDRLVEDMSIFGKRGAINQSLLAPFIGDAGIITKRHHQRSAGRSIQS